MIWYTGQERLIRTRLDSEAATSFEVTVKQFFYKNV